MARAALPALAAMLALAACSPQGAEQQNQGNEEEIQTVDVPQTVTQLPPGTTPMAERVAVLRLLNKRNGQMREFSLRPGQAVRAGDVIVRLGEMDVHDLQGMTDALRAHKPGDVVQIVILRDGARQTVTATLGTRGG